MRGAVTSSCLKFLALAALSTACGATVDPLGYESRPPEVVNAPDSDTLQPLPAPASYPNAFRELLGKSDVEVTAQLEAAFQRLFHGDPTAEAIYFTVGDDQAYIQDILHGDVRSEGMGLGMLIAVQLDHREEFDRLWRFAHASLEYDAGSARGHFRSTCSSGPCIDPYGHQELAMALLFAHGRWGSRSGRIDYGSEALRLFEVMWQTPPAAAGPDDPELTPLFDAEHWLVVDEPTRARAWMTRPSNVKPGYYGLWAIATGDDRFSQAAEAGRAFLRAAAHPRTGLLPLRADFDGVPVPGSDSFMPEGYRAQLNMALDFVWRDESGYVAESDRLLGFFVAQGPSYGSSYPLDGSRCINCLPSTALVAMNGVSALSATHAERSSFVEAVWDAEPPDGDARYYDGLLHLLSLLVLSGNLRVY